MVALGEVDLESEEIIKTAPFEIAGKFPGFDSWGLAIAMIQPHRFAQSFRI
jgi:hypothetical protein